VWTALESRPHDPDSKGKKAGRDSLRGESRPAFYFQPSVQPGQKTKRFAATGEAAFVIHRS